MAALGYFVDIYDLVLFLLVRKASLASLGYSGDDLVTHGTWLFNWQMGGMLIGGVLWGLLGDWRGRISLLFGSIVLYSIANLANAFVHDLNAYAACRFLAGLGLAGELGGSITLVSEVLPRELRGYGTMLVSAVGVLGAVVGGTLGLFSDWRTMFVIGGVLGLCLLALRATVSESGMYTILAGTNRPTFASTLILLAAPQRPRPLRLLHPHRPALLVRHRPRHRPTVPSSPSRCIAPAKSSRPSPLRGPMAASRWVISSAARFARPPARARAFSSRFSSRPSCSPTPFFFMEGQSPAAFYTLAFFLGISVGYWSVFVTVAAEHFGTNIRATVATTAPNFVRGAVIPITMLYPILKPTYGAIHSGLALGWLVSALAIIGWVGLRETFHDDLDYVEK